MLSCLPGALSLGRGLHGGPSATLDAVDDEASPFTVGFGSILVGLLPLPCGMSNHTGTEKP